jgi:hypothetical protein
LQSPDLQPGLQPDLQPAVHTAWRVSAEVQPYAQQACDLSFIEPDITMVDNMQDTRHTTWVTEQQLDCAAVGIPLAASVLYIQACTVTQLPVQKGKILQDGSPEHSTGWIRTCCRQLTSCCYIIVDCSQSLNGSG